MKTCCIRYEGRVQGVGFRATVLSLARGFDITGSVRNLMDGSVELIAQGDSKEIEEFLSSIRESHLIGHIQHEQEGRIDSDSLPPFRGFKIL
ncbi:MAG: acylphosphatase [Chthoniobacterales bacterium]|nr:acylphosphatase [Chthoniobacterales bacterium]